MRYVCRLGTPDGAILEETHEAADAQTLTSDLRKKGFHVFAVRPRGVPAFSFSLSRSERRSRRRKPVGLDQFLIFNQELAALLGAGLPLLQAIDLMLERQSHALFGSVLSDIRDRIANGQELSAAFEAHQEMFPRLYPSTLKAGERSGDLEKVIRRFVRYLKLVIDARKRVVSALVYPAVLIVLSLTMIGVMTVFVVPKFAVFYEGMEAELPKLTQVTLAIGSFFRGNWIVLTVATVAGLVFFRRWSRTPLGRIAIDRAKLRIPFIGPVLHRFALSEFCRSLATLQEGGLPLVPSLEISIGAIGNSYVRDRIHPAVQKVTEGRALFETLDESQVVDALAVDMVQVGEATGSLATMLSSVADFLDQEVEIRMGRILSLIEPVMLVFMGIIVGILLVSIYLPMFSLMGQVNG